MSICFKCSDITDFFGLYEQQIIHFFFLKLISTKSLSIFTLVDINFNDISSQIYKSIQPPLLSISNLSGSENPWNDSSFASEIVRMFILLLTTSSNQSNLFVKELMFNLAHINLFTLLSLRYISIFGLIV